MRKSQLFPRFLFRSCCLGLSLSLSALPALASDLEPTSQLEPSHQQEKRFYLGGMIGQARGAVGAAEMNARMAALGYDAQAEVNGQRRTAWGLFGGYEISSYVNLEVGFTDLGKVTTRLSGTSDDIDDYLTSATVVHPRSADGFELSLLGRYPLNERMDVFIRGGAMAAHSRYQARSAPDVANRGHHSTEFVYGVGGYFHINEHWSLRAGWNRYRIEDEKITLLGLSLLCRLPCLNNN